MSVGLFFISVYSYIDPIVYFKVIVRAKINLALW